MMHRFFSYILILLTVISCQRNNEEETQTLFRLLNNQEIGIDFINRLEYTEEFNTYTYRNFYNGAGVGLGDINNDGLIDIYFCGNTMDNKLYLNKGNLQFEDITEKAGVSCPDIWSTGVAMSDINGDGWLDMYICKSGSPFGSNRYNELFINDGSLPNGEPSLTFTEKAREYGLDDMGLSSHAAFFDYDKDGDLDCYLLNNAFRSVGGYEMKKNQRNIRDPEGGNKLYRNDSGKFVDVSERANIYGSAIGFGLGVTIGDINKDGWLDIYVSNDFFEKDYLYVNNQDGTFTESLEDYIRELSMGSMGADMADINNDGYSEIFVTEMTPEPEYRLKTKAMFESWEKYQFNLQQGYYHQFARNVLQLNNCNNSFSEIGRYAGIYATDWSWGALIFDMDNDGWKDIFVANGIYKDLLDQDYANLYSDPAIMREMIRTEQQAILKLIDQIPTEQVTNYAFQNQQDLTFKNQAKNWGLSIRSHSNGSAYGDLDNDGDLELVVNNVNMPPFIYENRSRQLTGHHYLTIILIGKDKNTQAVGSNVSLFFNNEIHYRELIPMRGFQSSVDNRLQFGLGENEMVDSLVVTWPDGLQTRLKDIKADQALTLNIREAQEKINTIKNKVSPFLQNDTSKIIDYVHVEDEYNDFNRERLIFHMISNKGPEMAFGDVNGDGTEDIYICGAKDSPGSLFIQNDEGVFIFKNQLIFEKNKISEDTDAAFFDADGDHDLDLYVCSGSNEFSSSSSALIDRLYLNNGNGDFINSDQLLPAGKFESSSCVSPGDYDSDGDTDLFVGIRLQPFLYGVPVNGYILQNDGNGRFMNVTEDIAPDLLGIGMITDMTWADIDGDVDQDMMIVGDFMSIKVFINENGEFIDQSAAYGLENTAGWWNTIEKADLDKDGDMDFVIGNHGLNSRFKASLAEPVTMYVNDFDRNGVVEQIICRYNDGKSYPMILKNELVEQIPSLAAKYPTHDSYKEATIDDVFSADQLNNAVKVNCQLLASVVLINMGKTGFEIRNLPKEAQFTPVFAIETTDINKDGNEDILLGGNLYKSKPEVGIYDGSYGVLLTGDGSGNFQHIPYSKSGFFVKGEIRDIKNVKLVGIDRIFVSINNQKLKIFK